MWRLGSPAIGADVSREQGKARRPRGFLLNEICSLIRLGRLVGGRRSTAKCELLSKIATSIIRIIGFFIVNDTKSKLFPAPQNLQPHLDRYEKLALTFLNFILSEAILHWLNSF
jgi:hypothetical protein